MRRDGASSADILYRHLPEAPWRTLVVNLGYPVGFLIVVLARRQLFTENTITVVLPVMAEPTAANFRRLARTWSVVLASNMVGTFSAALIAGFMPVPTPELRETMLEISRHAMPNGWIETLFPGRPRAF